MAKLTEEQRQERAAARARRTALEAEERARRDRDRREQWKREGSYLSWQEYLDGMPCRGCGLPVSDNRGAWRTKGTMHLTAEERVAYDDEEARYRELHADCHSHRWGVHGSATMHCGYCCPPPPMSPGKLEELARLFASFGKPDPRELDEWELTLTCNHITRKTQHRSNGPWNNHGTVDCVECQDIRGIIASRLLGPAVSEDERPVVERGRLEAELRTAEAKLARQQSNAQKAEQRVKELRMQLNDPDV